MLVTLLNRIQYIKTECFQHQCSHMSIDKKLIVIDNSTDIDEQRTEKEHCMCLHLISIHKK